MNAQSQSIAVGALAGAASILLTLGIATGSGLALMLYLLSPMPLMVAALGWGAIAGLTGVIACAAGVAIVASPSAAAFIMLTTTLPAALAAWWLGLSRPAEEVGGPKGSTVWYPLSDVIFRLALMTASAFVITGAMTGYGAEIVDQVVDQTVERMHEFNEEFIFSEEGRAEFTQFLTRAIPFVQPAFWLSVLVANLYFALALARQSGRLHRPRDIWPISLRLPRIAIIAFGVAIVGTFISGTAGLVANTFAGALFAGFTMAGFAVFHHLTHGKPWQILALVTAYGGTLILGFPVLFFAILGTLNLARNMPVTPKSGGMAPPPPSND